MFIKVIIKNRLNFDFDSNIMLQWENASGFH